MSEENKNERIYGFDEGTRNLLQDILTKKGNKNIKDLIDRVTNLEFHDYRSQHMAPKKMLIDALCDVGLDSIAERVCSGRYNQSEEEASKYFAEVKNGMEK